MLDLKLSGFRCLTVCRL